MKKGRDKKSIKKGILLQKSHSIPKVEKNSTNQKPSTRNTVNREVADCTTVSSTKHSSQFNRASFAMGSKAHSNMLLCNRYVWKKKTEANVSSGAFTKHYSSVEYKFPLQR